MFGHNSRLNQRLFASTGYSVSNIYTVVKGVGLGRKKPSTPGEWITELRERIRDNNNLPISASQLGSRVGLSRSQMRRVERDMVPLVELPHRAVVALRAELGPEFDAVLAMPPVVKPANDVSRRLKTLKAVKGQKKGEQGGPSRQTGSN